MNTHVNCLHDEIKKNIRLPSHALQSNCGKAWTSLESENDVGDAGNL